MSMASSAKFYHMIQIILLMRSCDQSLVTLAFLRKKLNKRGKTVKTKVRKFWGLVSTFVEVTGEKLAGGPFWGGICPRQININIIYILM